MLEPEPLDWPVLEPWLEPALYPAFEPVVPLEPFELQSPVLQPPPQMQHFWAALLCQSC